jgi:hypothetical protein
VWSELAGAQSDVAVTRVEVVKVTIDGVTAKLAWQTAVEELTSVRCDLNRAWSEAGLYGSMWLGP